MIRPKLVLFAQGARQGSRFYNDRGINFQAAGDLLQPDDGRLGRVAGEVGADLGRADVADDAERRVVERVAVLVDLGVRLVERLVLALALVLPGEPAALPDVDEAVVAPGPLRRGTDDLTCFSTQ